MDPNTFFTMALGLQSPWEVKSLQVSMEDKRWDILVDFERGSTFPCPESAACVLSSGVAAWFRSPHDSWFSGC